MKNVILNVDDIPSAKALEHAAERLIKDHDLLACFKGKANKNDDPAAFLEIARFLNMLANREGKRLNNE